MVISDFIFSDLNRQSNCFCRVRICVNGVGEVCAVITDISDHILSGSVTNNIENIYEKLLLQGFIPENIEIFEHYESESLDSFELVTFLQNNEPRWVPYSKEALCEKYEITTKHSLQKQN